MWSPRDISLCLCVPVLSLYSYSGHAEETPKAVLVLDPDQTQFYSGETVTLRCSIEGQDTSGWKFLWRRDGHVVHPPQGWTVYNECTIHSLDESYSGDYTCTGLKDGKDVQSETVKLRISALPTATLTVEPQSPVFTGETVTLKCVIEPERVWRYKWYKDRNNNLLPQSSTSTHTITVTKSDGGYYWCQGEMRDRPVSSQMSGRVYLTVKAPPEAMVTVVSPHSPYYPGETVTLRCDIAEYTDWDQYDWYKDNNLISDQNRKTIIISLPDHDVQYTCEGRSEGRPKNPQRSDPVSIFHTALPTATLTVEPQDPVYVGDTVTLKCVIEPEGVWKYKWYKGRNSYLLSQSDTDTHTATVAKSDEGQYWCQGERKDRPTSSQPSRRITLDVKALPTATLSVVPPHGPYYPGERVTLRCDIAEYGDWDQYYWYRGSDDIHNGPSQTTTISLPNKAGQYRCGGHRGSRPTISQRSAPVSISITALPTATLTVEPQGPVFTGETVTLKCVIEPERVWKYKWYKDRNSNLLPQSDTSTHTITVAKSDKGPYWCQGEMKGRPVSSQMSGRVYLMVKALPEATVAVVSPHSPYYPGETVTLRCDIAGYTDWDQYDWYKDNKFVSGQTKKTIISSLPDHAGQYTCEGRRGGRPEKSQRSAPVSIFHTALPTATLTVEPQSPVFTGETVTLNCVIEHERVWKYKWYTDKRQDLLPQSDTSTHTIIADQSHKGQYWCQGERIDRPTSSQPSRKITLDVKAKPTATLSVVSPQGPYYPGDEVTLRCDIAEYTDWDWYYWYRGSYYILSQRSQTTTIFLPVHVGQFQCTCEGERGSRPTTSQRSAPISITLTAMPVPTLTVEPALSSVFAGETVTLTCVIQPSGGWTYEWYKGWMFLASETNTYTISRATVSDQGEYKCLGVRKTNRKSYYSNIVQLTVRARPQAVLRGPPQTWLTEGGSVTLSCEVEGSTTGWIFHWYKTAPYSSGLVYVKHDDRSYYVELVSDSISGAGGSYTLSPAALRHTGVYVCRAERGEPAYHTEFSQPQPLWVSGVSPPASVIIHSNWTQIFTDESLSLSCGVQGNSTGWRLRWFTGRGGESKCPTDWRSETGSTCTIRLASSSDSGVYWCLESGEQRNPVNITVHTGNVILESPAHPVTGGDPLTLRCRYRYKPSHISADFYKDGTLLQTSTTGEMTIPAVSESHEGVYRCRNPEKGESPESWVTVRGRKVSDSESSNLVVAVGVVVGLLIAFALVILLVLLYRSRKVNVTPNPGQQQSNSPSSTSQQRQVVGGAVAGSSDVVYAEIELKETDAERKKKAKTGSTKSDTLYSILKPVKKPDLAGPSDVTYADVQIKMKPQGNRAKPTSSEEDCVYSSVQPGCSSDGGSSDVTYAQVRKGAKKPGNKNA
ncbi:Fc receptor-like protein 5 isoform X2 [Clupea harengus]|uniref:Fc receptor-like protein 5 isoform X2 n=1 Tax=Clupea harengus TaxID=7950 RepID=A0A6P8H004_CLUHA|nr:Fc receptor-like protein 5 isoform X2 [Clupea harengus]